jgi:hypothetical protein
MQLEGGELAEIYDAITRAVADRRQEGHSGRAYA